MIVRRLRLWSGVVLAAYIIPHVLNHGLGVFSFAAMDWMRQLYGPAWRSWPGTVLLGSAFLVHLGLSLWALYHRPHLRMPVWEAAQLVLGLLIVPLCALHVVGSRVFEPIVGIPPTYESVVAGITAGGPLMVTAYALLIVVTYAHAVVGLHFWLRVRNGYRRWIPVLYPLAVVICVVGVLGFVSACFSVDELYADPLWAAEFQQRVISRTPELLAWIEPITGASWLVFGFLVAGVFVARRIRHAYRLRRGRFTVTVPGGRSADAPTGHTVLDALRFGRIPHASVCGGRGRCTTCRVSIQGHTDPLPPPREQEARALARIGASSDIRLACMLRPIGDVQIVPLLPAGATARDANRPGGVQGREQDVVIMFADLRGSTRLGEEKLPYDVLFILNQFFAEMAAALTETGGHYAQFSGDGLMALYGIETDVRTGCHQALSGAGAMLQRLERLNERLHHSLTEPLRMGIGIHCGAAIVGTMGPPNAPNFSAIGDNVNVAARLEALTKTEGCPIVISASVAERGGLDLRGLSTGEVEIRGRNEPISIYRVSDPAAIPGLMISA